MRSPKHQLFRRRQLETLREMASAGGKFVVGLDGALANALKDPD